MALRGLEVVEGWGEVQRAAMGRVLHLGEEEHPPTIHILVHSSAAAPWVVTMLEVVGDNHQVELGALLVVEGLARSREGRGRMVLATWEAVRGDLGPWPARQGRDLNNNTRMVGSRGIVRSRGAIGGWRGSVRGRSRSVAILRGRAWAIGWSWAVSIYGSLKKNFIVS